MLKSAINVCHSQFHTTDYIIYINYFNCELSDHCALNERNGSEQMLDMSQSLVWLLLRYSYFLIYSVLLKTNNMH